MDTEGQPQTPEGNQVQGVTEDTCVNLPLECLGNKRAKLEKWFRENIKKKECAHFVKSDAPSDGREEVCYCGNAKSQHKYEDRNLTESQWDQEKHIKEVATDAYGDLIFKDRGKKKAKYVRASDSTPPEVLYEMMRTQWKLEVPKLVISVTGGARNFSVNDSLKKLFSKGLVKAAQSTGAWIITGGCHAGVAELVGEAVGAFSRSGGGYHEIVTIGIAPWGALHNRDRLIRKEDDQLVEYCPDVSNEHGRRSLDYKHSHFILVDDGTQDNCDSKTSSLRTKLETYISEQTMKEEAVKKIPTVRVVLSGSLNTLDIIQSSVTNNTPCVMVEGWGGVADVIAQGVKINPSEFTDSEIREKLRSLQDTYEDETITKATDKIKDIMRMSHLLTIFREDKGRAQDLDVAEALLKASQSMDPENRVYQLCLAVLWSRLDIAKNDIFNSEWSWKSEDLYPALTVALIENKTGFVQLFLEKGVRLRDYVTEKTLIHLYNYMKPNTHFGWKLNKIKRDQQKNKDGVTRQHIDEALKRLYTFRKELQTAVNNTGQSPSDTHSKIAYPIRDLLIWAVVQNRGELAEIIWTQCQDCIVGALACSMILRALYKKEEDINTVEEMKVLANLFEERASGVFSECCREDEGRAEQLLTRRSSGWGEATCLQLAGNTKAMSFMSNGGVQNYLTKMWYGKLSNNNSFIRLLFCMTILPLFCPSSITLRQESGTPSCCERLRAFVTAPVVIFYYNAASYIGFLWLFAYVLMMDFQTTPSCIEYVLYAWVFSLLCEEGRQLFYEHEGVTFLTKLLMYINDFWNQMDVLAIVLFIIGVVFRWFTASFYAARVIFAVDYIVFCLRLMDDFTVNRILGPKIIMVQKMIKDLYFFLFLLAVWVVSFGVSKQAILVHNEQRFYWIFRNVLYEPYLILFGQIPADVDTLNFNNNICTADGSDASLPKCVETLDGVPIFPEWLTIILLCLYLLFAIILLLNLLIAMFNHTFSEVQGNTDQFWKFQRQKLIVEYSKRPSVPPPPILLNYLYNVLCYLVKKCKLKKENGDLGLLSWEEKMKIDYLKKKKEEQSQSTDMKIRDIYDKIDAVVKLQNNVTAIQKRQEEQVSKGLKDIMKLLKENRSEEKAPVVEDPPSS